MSKEEWSQARSTYLRVISSYPDYRAFNEYEYALYRAALATFGTMKGAEYNLEQIESPSGAIEQRGALDLIEDYLSEISAETALYRSEVLALRDRVFDLLAWRDLKAAQTYDGYDRETAATTQYRFVVSRWGDPARFPGQQEYVEQARNELVARGEAVPAFGEILPVDIDPPQRESSD